MGLRILLVVVLIIPAVVAVAVVYGAVHWDSGTRQMRSRLEAARVQTPSKVVDFGELVGLPAPVQRYFRSVLKDGQPMVAAVSVEHTGTFNMSETVVQWKSFRSTQRVITQPPASTGTVASR